MTREEAIALIDQQVASLGTVPLSPDWMYSAIRHCQRNMDFDIDFTDDGPHDYADGNQPDRYAGRPIAIIINALPQIRALLAEIR